MKKVPRFYLRGLTPLGILNTLLAALTDHVIVLHVDTHTRAVVKISLGDPDDFPPEEKDEKTDK